jgi:hypothetical protein
VNLVSDGARASVVRQLRDETLRWMVDTSDVVPT